MFEVETGAPVVAFVGNGFARKGLGPLLEAWPAIESHPYLLVAGTDRSALRYIRLAHRLGVGSRVRFLGAVGQIEQLFHAADAFALPSFFEPFGNVVMEAMAGGLGVLVSAQSGVAELLPAAMHPFVVKDPANSGRDCRAPHGAVADEASVRRDRARRRRGPSVERLLRRAARDSRVA